MDKNLQLLKSRDLKAASIPDFGAGGVIKLSSDILSTEVVVDCVSKSVEKKKIYPK